MALSMTARPEVAGLEPVEHGGYDYGELARLGIRADELLDFSVNSNPFGPPPRVRSVWDELELERYPDRECLALRAAMARKHQCALEQVWVGNGAAELIWLLSLTYLRPGDSVLIGAPTFGEYAGGAELMGARVETFVTYPEAGFEPDIEALAARLQAVRPRLTFLCNPNNPTGVYLERSAIGTLLAANPAGLLVLDEAYLPFVADAWSSLPLLETGALVLLRSMTKDCALAGLRLGYLLAPTGTVAMVRRTQPPWSVNAVAQRAGLVALEEAAYLRTTMAQTAVARAELAGWLTELGLRVWPTATNFFLVQVEDAAATRSELLRHGVLVRDCRSFGLPSFVRVATRRPEENRRLVQAWQEILDRRYGNARRDTLELAK